MRFLLSLCALVAAVSALPSGTGSEEAVGSGSLSARSASGGVTGGHLFARLPTLDRTFNMIDPKYREAFLDEGPDDQELVRKSFGLLAKTDAIGAWEEFMAQLVEMREDRRLAPLPQEALDYVVPGNPLELLMAMFSMVDRFGVDHGR